MTVVRQLVGAVALGVLMLANVDVIIVQETTSAPPMTGERSTEGCSRRLHRGQHVMHVAGDPYTLGFCNGALSAEIMGRQEQALLDALHGFFPWRPLQLAVLRTVAWIYRDLPKHLTESERLEIAGIVSGYPDPNPELGPQYSRILDYHAIHDISQAMVDNPLLACSGFGASGSATRDGHTLLARVFDFEGGPVFDEDKIVLFYEPDYGIPFVSVIWAGMVGAVSGMNVEGIAVTLNAAASDHAAVEGTPTTLVVRRILQHARSIDDAIAIARASTVFVTDILTVVDGDTGELAVLEMTPAHIHVRRGETTVLATNHLLHPGHAGDDSNAARIEQSTTKSRFDRLAERVREAHGTLDAPTALSILRDRSLPGGREVGPGHRGTIDALIAAHAVIFDATERRLWVSTPPHTLGEFVEYDLRAILRGPTEDSNFERGALPADPMLTDGRWDRLVQARSLLEAGGLDRLEQAAELAPGYPPAQLALARACEGAGDDECAQTAYRAFLALSPPHHKNRVFAEEKLHE